MKLHVVCFQWVLLVIVLCFEGQVLSQDDWPSPCPRLFDIVGKKAGSWDGNFNLVSEKPLGGVWFRLEFDRAVSRLETTFGESVEAKSESLFLIKSRNTTLPAHTVISVPFSVTYDEYSKPPKLQAAYLNYVKICPEKEEEALTTPMKHVAYGIANPGGPVTTSLPKPNPDIASSPVSGPPQWNGRTTTQRPELTTNKAIQELLNSEKIYTTQPLADGDGDGIYPGDIAFSSRYDSEFEKNCGTVIIPATKFFIHGQPSKAGEFPWHAALYKAKNALYICGGSLVSQHFVVTAAQCVTHNRTGAAIHPKHFQVLLGKYYMDGLESNANTQGSKVVQVIPLGEYNSRTFRNDIALLKMAKAAVLTDFVRPICLWEGNNDIVPLHNQLGTICGWGFDETLKTTSELKQAKMPVVSKATCLKSNPKFAMYVSDLSYCAGLRNGTSACNGDSGGGMVFPKREDPNRWVLRGVVSISLRSQGREACDIDNYAVFTDAAKYTGWIKENIKPKYF